MCDCKTPDLAGTATPPEPVADVHHHRRRSEQARTDVHPHHGEPNAGATTDASLRRRLLA